ncbi:MAG: CHC2 zinc finger domain-containing protein, partial [Microvirga sp.]
MSYDEQRFERIRARNPLRDYLARIGVKVDQQGFFLCVNPAHSENTPSAHITPRDPDKWICFGCDARGDVIDLAALSQGISLAEAANQLDDDKPGTPPPPKPKREKPKLRIVRGEYGPVPDDAPKPEGNVFTLWIESKTRPGEWTERKQSYTHLFPYRDRQGLLQAYVLRRDRVGEDGQKRKLIMPLRWNIKAKRFDAAGFTMHEPRPLFNEDQLVARPDAEVLVVEGEKTALVAAALFPSM